MPDWYPPPIPVTGPDGSIVHGPDGKVLVHRDMTQFNRELLPGEFCFFCFVVLVGWLLIRFCRFLYARWRYRNRVA